MQESVTVGGDVFVQESMELDAGRSCTALLLYTNSAVCTTPLVVGRVSGNSVISYVLVD